MNVESKKFYESIRQCNRNLLCRLEVIDKQGYNGLRSVFSDLRFIREQVGAGPSVSQIEKALNYLQKAVGLIAGKAFRYKTKGFLLMYKGHFEVLKMADESLRKYWDHMEFLSWAIDVIGDLERKTQMYCRETGYFDFSKFYPTTYTLSKSEYDQSIEKLQRVRKIMTKVDECLLGDIGQIYALLIEGLDKVMTTPLPKNNFDLIAYNKTMETLMFFVANSSFNKITEVPKRLIRHYDSWDMQVYQSKGRAKFTETIVLSKKLKDKLVLAIKKWREDDDSIYFDFNDGGYELNQSGRRNL